MAAESSPTSFPHLFDRFTRSPGARQGRQRGSGLGLFIVHDLLEANGGSIRYEPSASVGARFTLALRTAQPETDEPGEVAARAQ